jgi:hypothetical protein
MVILLLHGNHTDTLRDQGMARGYGSRAELREMMLEQFQLMPNAVGIACVCSWLGGLMGRCINSRSSMGDSNVKELGQCQTPPILPLILQLGVNSLKVVSGGDTIGTG